MPFYVPVGPRGLLFRFGTILTGVLGALCCWRADRRRALATIRVADPPAERTRTA